MLIQMVCLIRSMVNRRITIMQRRDQNLPANNDDDDEGFIDGLFGSILTMPLPVPEILENLDKTTFASKQEKYNTQKKEPR